MDTPWGNAAGTVKTPAEAEMMAHTGVGWVEAGSISLNPRPLQRQGNEDLYHHNPINGLSHNSLKLFNPGIDAVEEQIPDMAKVAHGLGKKLFINVAPVSEDPVAESQELAWRSYEAGADAVVINAGCPTVAKDGKNDILSYNFDLFKATIDGLELITEKHHPVFVKISPQESFSDMRRIIRPINRDIVSAVITVNTWLEEFEPNNPHNPILQISGGPAGKSGPGMAKDAFKQTAWAVSAAQIGRRKLDVISAGGIMTGEELELRTRLGAVAGSGTTLYYESAEEGWNEATDRLLRQYAEATG